MKKRNSSSQSSFEKFEINVDKQIEKEFRGVERWIIERRKFFIKSCGIILFFILVILLDYVVRR